MNWSAVLDGLILIVSWMLGSLVVALVIAWSIRHFFPRKPEDDYTYVIKSKSGKKTVVVLPPDLPEAERKKIMAEAYQRLGIAPESGH
ncbi:hypothetical protein GTP91_22730 [Rugamonas sp. FT82W]|uniref:Uncharacterized protein n=1 Tax=Duganella vulcania TaxID=2692166 RepID=A0A845G5M0_9BURK|nr:hypothetical protein [Duganella vulcania]MYM89973.1 hypothetical protein [Duganella vulcania]